MPREHEPTVEMLQDELKRLRAQNEALHTRLYELQAAHRLLQGEEEEYGALRHRIRDAIRQSVPADEIVLVVGKGDPTLVDLYGREAWHFPRQDDGRYAGYYPKREISAIAHLEAMRARGAAYLLIPTTSLWWLDDYPKFGHHLKRRYRCVLDDPESCVIYAIHKQTERATDPASRLEQALEDFAPVLGDDPAILDWGTGFGLKSSLSSRTVFSPPTDDPALPYLADTVDVVAVRTEDADILREAERVASKVVVNLAAGARVDTADWLRWNVPPDDSSVPSVSIVIPCHDGVAYTQSCLATLDETLPQWFEGEIIVVDDASSDRTSDLLRRLKQRDDRIHVIRNRSNKGFLESCNRGAKAARGDYLLFLNNDTVLLPEWLPPLISTFVAYPDAGAVGGKLLFEDGTLQEAGALVFADASAAKLGYLEPDVETPLYHYPREVDYVSAAFLTTPRSLFGEIGGFDSRYGFGYYDDDDYCFAVRATGRKVYYQPESAIVHVEGGSAGTDLSEGLKHYQLANQKIFAEKWKRELALKPERLDPSPLDWSTAYSLAGGARST